MTERIQFTRNYTDQSTNTGFQFEFHCDRCGNGFRSRFIPSASGLVSSALDTASSLFGGLFSSASTVGNNVHSATWQKAKDDAFIAAAKELIPEFAQCPRCQSWVCRKDCWNNKRGLCKNCAPDLAVEMSAVQAAKALEEIQTSAQISDEDKKVVSSGWNETIAATCPQCGKPLATTAKFCPECGYQVKKKVFCTECGSQLTPGTKFCPECGARQGG